MQLQTELVICPIMREENGLAKSSRNLRLTESERTLAAELFKTLSFIKNNIAPGNFLTLKNQAVSQLENDGFKVEYLELANSENLEILTDYDQGKPAVLLLAAFLNNVRLIDNLRINA